MEVGESSAAKLLSSNGEVWAKLVPSDPRYSDVEIMSNEVVICSEIASSSTEKHKWCKIKRNSDPCSATIKNISSNSILVDEAPVQNEDCIVIKSGSDIVPDPDQEGVLSYRFNLMPSPEPQKQQIKVCIDFEQAKCGICLNIWHDVVTVAPCLHNFCNGCFSEWLRRSQEKHASVLCPHCRSIVQFVGRNHFLRNIEKDILQADPALKQSDEEVALLDSYALIQSNLVIGTGKNHRRKRARTPVDVESDSIGLCPQCETAFGGFRCNQGTIHLQCCACNGMMPSRTDIILPQHCMGCDRAFCGAYWHAQGGMNGDLHAMCSRETFKPISQYTISQIPNLAHESNQHEQDVTERCISQMGRTLQDVVSEWIAKLNCREIDRTRMPLNHAEMITPATHVCNECYDKLVSFLLYWFRISIPKHHLPPGVADREDCWYGYACRTQHRSEEHASKRNHVCRPTRR